MMDPVRELKIRAELLQKALGAGEAQAFVRMRALAEFARADEETLAAAAPAMQRKHALAIVARECGFENWEHAKRVLEGDPKETHFGTLLYDKASTGFLLTWFARYEEARAFLDETKRRDSRHYLLAYRRQFFAAEAPFIATLGLDPDDPDWHALDWDWAKPRDRAARARLYVKRLAAQRGGR